METAVRDIVFTALNQVECLSEQRELAPPGDGVLIRTRYTCISAGTEVAKLSGLQQIDYPTRIGNRAVGRVIEVGPRCREFEVGDLVFTHALHSSHTEGRQLVVRLPDSLDRPESALLGMALVAFTGLRVAQPELGDRAVVTGAGLVGQFMAQLLALSGVTPILLDRVESRLAIARSCGVSHTVHVAHEEAPKRVAELTDGRGVEHVFECTGNPAVVESVPAYAGRSAQVILVGSPRGEHNIDLTGFLAAFHLWRPHGDLTLKGAHEWKIPLCPQHGAKHSQQRNARILVERMQAGQLQTTPLLTGVFRPEDCQEAYHRLQTRKDEHLGVVFDWTQPDRSKEAI